jgi:hypothetical protein
MSRTVGYARRVSNSRVESSLLTVIATSVIAFGPVGCGAAVSPMVGADRASMDAVVDAGQPVDVRVDAPPPDALAPYACNVARDCEALPPPGMTRFGRGWSCMGGRCTWEPMGGQTCRRAANGCIECDGRMPVCTDPCLTSLRDGATRMESSNCARAFFSSIGSCVGSFVSLTDGPLCVLTDANTGAPRYILSCGVCEVVFLSTM